MKIGNTLLSNDLKDVYFSCCLDKCKGACCVEGDAGAPLEAEEISLLEDHLAAIIPFMMEAGIREVELKGVFDYDAEGKFVTPLVNEKECAYTFYENGITRCAIEKAFQEKAISFPKPISCHLYPVRISSGKYNDRLNYHKWHICRYALQKGYQEHLMLYQFLEDALIRKYGRSWYNKLLKLLD